MQDCNVVFLFCFLFILKLCKLSLFDVIFSKLVFYRNQHHVVVMS